MWVLPALLLGLALLLGACGGNDNGSPAETATPGPVESPSLAATASPTVPATPPPEPTATPAEPAATPTSAPPPPTATSAPPGPTPSDPTFSYTVQTGDTLFSIAQRFGTTVGTLAALNNLEDASRIRVGQSLLIPGSGPPPVTATPPPASGSAQVVRQGNPNRREVVLTFDAGADAGYTQQILQTLRAENIRAAFGITGVWAERYPDLMRQIVTDGHDLINHSWDHASFTGFSTDRPALTRAERWSQLDRTEEAILRLTGKTTKPYFRPPFGDYDASVNADVHARGYTFNVMWTVDSWGWRGISASEISERCLSMAAPGAIYIFHVGAASQDAAALPAIISGLRAEGYQFVSLPDLLARG